MLRSKLGLAALLGLALAFASPALAGGAPWSGIYAGGAIGYAAATTETSLDVAGFNDLITVDGFGAEGVTFTGVAGADIQTGSIVFGVWGSWTGDDLKTSIGSNVPGLSRDLASLEIESRWAVGGRAGYLVTDTTLVYGLAGYTRAKTSDLEIPIAAASFAVPDLKGYVVGGGVEIELHDGLFLHAQYTYSAFDQEQIALSSAPAIALNIEPHVQEAHAGLTYKFNFWDR